MQKFIALALSAGAGAAFHHFVPRRRKIVLARIGIAMLALTYLVIDTATRFILPDG